MSRQVPFDKPLSEADREYLNARGRHDLVDMVDRRTAEAEPEDQEPEPVEPADEGDNYDDTDVWSYADLQAEAGRRGLSKSGSRDDLVARLREWDAANPQ